MSKGAYVLNGYGNTVRSLYMFNYILDYFKRGKCKEMIITFKRIQERVTTMGDECNPVRRILSPVEAQGVIGK